MKEFLFLFIGGDAEYAKLSPKQMEKEMGKWFAWIDRMRAAGIYKDGNPLDAPARTIHGPDRLVTDGPFAEAKEVVGGYMLIAVKDIEEAVKHARECPIFEVGGRVEVRPILPLEHP